eukprot:gene8554-6000_t
MKMRLLNSLNDLLVLVSASVIDLFQKVKLCSLPLSFFFSYPLSFFFLVCGLPVALYRSSLPPLPPLLCSVKASNGLGRHYMHMEPVPLCLLCGNLGAGKTTLLRSLLVDWVAHADRAPQTSTPRLLPNLVLTIVNDYSSTSIDGFALDDAPQMEEAEQSLEVSYAQRVQFQKQLERVQSPRERLPGAWHIPVELAGGCVCCNLLASLVCVLEAAYNFNYRQNEALKRVLCGDAAPPEDGVFPCYGYIFLECTGVGESVPVVAAVEHHPRLRHKVAVDAVLTVVDARALLAAAPLGAPGDPEEQIQPFLASHAGLTAETLKGTNVLVANAWEHAVAVEIQRCAARGGEQPAALAMRLEGHLRSLMEALRLVSDRSTARVGSASTGVQVCWTSKGALADVFYSRIFRKNIFSAQFPPSETETAEGYFSRAFGARRVQALREGRIIAVDVAPSGEEVEVPMEMEAAREQKKLGALSWTLELPLQGRQLTDEMQPWPVISEVRAALESRDGRALLRHVWRSKGFFYAVDDEDPVSSVGRRLVQFRWQTVGKHVHYGEVVPPYAPLASQCGQPLLALLVFIGPFADSDEEWKERLTRLFGQGLGLPRATHQTMHVSTDTTAWDNHTVLEVVTHLGTAASLSPLLFALRIRALTLVLALNTGLLLPLGVPFTHSRCPEILLRVPPEPLCAAAFPLHRELHRLMRAVPPTNVPATATATAEPSAETRLHVAAEAQRGIEMAKREAAELRAEWTSAPTTGELLLRSLETIHAWRERWTRLEWVGTWLDGNAEATATPALVEFAAALQVATVDALEPLIAKVSEEDSAFQPQLHTSTPQGTGHGEADWAYAALLPPALALLHSTALCHDNGLPPLSHLREGMRQVSSAPDDIAAALPPWHSLFAFLWNSCTGATGSRHGARRLLSPLLDRWVRPAETALAYHFDSRRGGLRLAPSFFFSVLLEQLDSVRQARRRTVDYCARCLHPPGTARHVLSAAIEPKAALRTLDDWLCPLVEGLAERLVALLAARLFRRYFHWPHRRAPTATPARHLLLLGVQAALGFAAEVDQRGGLEPHAAECVLCAVFTPAVMRVWTAHLLDLASPPRPPPPPAGGVLTALKHREQPSRRTLLLTDENRKYRAATGCRASVPAAEDKPHLVVIRSPVIDARSRSAAAEEDQQLRRLLLQPALNLLEALSSAVATPAVKALPLLRRITMNTAPTIGFAAVAHALGSVSAVPGESTDAWWSRLLWGTVVEPAVSRLLAVYRALLGREAAPCPATAFLLHGAAPSRFGPEAPPPYAHCHVVRQFIADAGDSQGGRQGPFLDRRRAAYWRAAGTLWVEMEALRSLEEGVQDLAARLGAEAVAKPLCRTLHLQQVQTREELLRLCRRGLEECFQPAGDKEREMQFLYPSLLGPHGSAWHALEEFVQTGRRAAGVAGEPAAAGGSAQPFVMLPGVWSDVELLLQAEAAAWANRWGLAGGQRGSGACRVSEPDRLPGSGIPA